MPTLHENRGPRFVTLGSLLAGCLWLTTCGGNTLRVDHPPPAPPAAQADAPQLATLPPVFNEPSPAVSPQESEPVQPLVTPASSSDPTIVDAALAQASEPDATLDSQTDLSWEEMTAKQRATHLQLEGLEFEANRVAAEFSDLETEEEAEEPTLLEELTETPIPDDYSLAESREEILRRTQSDLPLALNAQVIKLINYFSSGRGLKTYRATMDRGAAYKEMIERICEEEDVPKELFHLAQAESGFMPKARSWARATGMWQFVSYRGRQYGLRQDRYLEERYDPEKATRAAARHLKDLYIEFGDWYLAMAAYNGGPERVRRAIRRSGSRDYWTLSERHLLKRETRNYLPIILSFIYLTKNQQLYDLGTPDPAPPVRYDTVPTNSEVSLQLAADLTDSTIETLKQLNPALLRSATPPAGYELRLPKGTAEQFREQLALIPEDKRLKWRRHAIQEGETLAAIAKQYRVPEQDIVALNELPGETLQAGQRLTIPTETKLEVYASAERAGGFVEGGTGRYRVGRGDTLGSISRRFGVSVAQLMSWNGLTSTRIRAGRYLLVNAQGGGSRTNSARSSKLDSGTAPSGRYTVRRGDSLTVIAARYRVSVSDLQGWNSLRDGDIHVGQVLRVPGMQVAKAAESAPASGLYRIRQGDNLAAIARQFGVSVEDLKAWNDLRGTSIRAGESLRVAPAAKPAPRVSKASLIPVASAAQTVPAAAPAGGQRYRIRRGDSLAGIAERFHVSVEQLKAWNRLRGSRITAGEDLHVSPPSGGAARPATNATSSARPAAASSPAAKTQRYRIRRGDTLDSIAKRFGVSVDDLKSWNRLRNSRIHEGNYLTIQTEVSEKENPQKLASAGGG